MKLHIVTRDNYISSGNSIDEEYKIIKIYNNISIPYCIGFFEITDNDKSYYFILYKFDSQIKTKFNCIYLKIPKKYNDEIINKIINYLTNINSTEIEDLVKEDWNLKFTPCLINQLPIPLSSIVMDENYIIYSKDKVNSSGIMTIYNKRYNEELKIVIAKIDGYLLVSTIEKWGYKKPRFLITEEIVFLQSIISIIL